MEQREGHSDRLEGLLESCRSGDDLAWEALVRTHQGRVFGMARHYLGDPEEARDVAQVVFIRIYQNLHLCVDSSMFLPWLIRIARNACLDQLRRKKARPPAFDIPAEDTSVGEYNGSNPEQLSIEASRRELLQKALGTLTRFNREIILLREIQGLSIEETAAILKKPVGTVKSRLYRARIQLAERLMLMTGGQTGMSCEEVGP